jgi:hypothetical protein
VWQFGSSMADPDPKDMYLLKNYLCFNSFTNLGLDRLNIGVKDATIRVLRIDLTVPSLGKTRSSAGTSAKLSFFKIMQYQYFQHETKKVLQI